MVRTPPGPGVLAGDVKLPIDAPYAQIVGFAAWYDDFGGNNGRWHRLGIDTDSTDGFAFSWNTTMVRNAIGKDFVASVYMIPCFALNVPKPAGGLYQYMITTGRRQASVTRNKKEFAKGPPKWRFVDDPALEVQGRRMACRNPNA